MTFRKFRPSRGAAAVEMAIILPVLILLIFGALEMGRAVMVQHILEEASRAGCRVASMEDPQSQDVEDIVDAAMAKANITGYTITIDPDPPSNAYYKDAVTVTVSVPYSDVSWLPVDRFMGGRTMEGACIMPAESGEELPAGKKTKTKNNKKTKK